MMTGAKGLNASGEERLVFNFEWPFPYFVAQEARTKAELERLHLERFITDFTIATTKPPYTEIQRAGDPPDFLCLSGGVLVNVDCAQLAIQNRRAVNGLFERLRRAILSTPRERFSRLRGCVVYVWFEGSDGKLSMPFSSADDRALVNLVELLIGYEPQPSALQLPTDTLPEQAPMLPTAEGEGCRFYAVQMADAVPTSEFFTRTGFELGLAYTTNHSRPSASDELARVVAKHDQDGIDHLLLTAGGPNVNGLIHLSEHVLSAFLLETPPVFPKPNHLSKVMLHLWQTGAIVQLFPEVAVITGDLYGDGVGLASRRASVPPSVTSQSDPRIYSGSV